MEVCRYGGARQEGVRAAYEVCIAIPTRLLSYQLNERGPERCYSSNVNDLEV